MKLRKLSELKGFEDFNGYSVSDDGKVFSHYKRNDKQYIITKNPYRELKPQINKKGYAKVRLSQNRNKKSASVHRLVALAFIPNPSGYPQVDHLDCNKQNNDVSNLEWVTGKENHRRKCENGLNVVKSGEQHYTKIRGYKEGDHHCCKKILQIDKHGNVVAEYKALTLAAKAVGVDRTSISKVLHGVIKTAGGYKWKLKV